MENTDYKNVLLEIVSMIKDKATYLKTIDSNNTNLYNEQYYNGMAFAYSMVLDGIKTYIESNEISLSDFGLDNYDPSEIMKYKPLNL